MSTNMSDDKLVQLTLMTIYVSDQFCASGFFSNGKDKYYTLLEVHLELDQKLVEDLRATGISALILRPGFRQIWG